MSESELGPAVSGAVSALINAYKNAGSIVENVKQQRRARGASCPSEDLEEALQEGHREIEKISAKGIQRFGAGFEQGDDIAYRALQGLTIELQSLFLTLAGKDYNAINFDQCLDSAIGARLRAVNILNELYLRQQKRARSNTASDTTTTSQRSSVAKTDISQASADEMKEVVEGPSPTSAIKRSSTMESRSSGRAPSERSGASIRLSHKPSWGVFKVLQRSSTDSTTRENAATLSPESARPLSYVVSPILSPQSTPASPFAAPLRSSAPAQVITPPISPISNISPLDRLSTAGFCKGAYYIQQGTLAKGLQLSAKNMQWTCHCRKCPFAIPATMENGRPHFDDKAHSTSKLRWRSLLLFKAHVASKEKKKRIYKCAMCILLGEKAVLFDGEHDLFEHMINHQGGVLNGVELWGPLCVDPSGVRIGTETTFDICFAENPRFALPESAFEMSIATEIVEADSREIPR